MPTPTQPNYSIDVINRVSEISPQDWDLLNTMTYQRYANSQANTDASDQSATDQSEAATAKSNNPVTTSHAFLRSFEESKVLARNGWQGHHLIIRDTSSPERDDQIVGILIAYRKTNSMGEFVFDFAWADAYERYGMQYYPKLVSAVPFTPATGSRLLMHREADFTTLQAVITRYLEALLESGTFSSHHINFCHADYAAQVLQSEQHLSADTRYLRRSGTQYHWRNKGFSDFDDFLNTLSSKRRKNIRRERRLAKESSIKTHIYTGASLPDDFWTDVYHCYALTFYKRMREAPLSEATFRQWGRNLGERMLIFAGLGELQITDSSATSDASSDGQDNNNTIREGIVAAAICFRDDTHLYAATGGALADIDCLHFEICYYMGIDYCIRENLAVFEPGAQVSIKSGEASTPPAPTPCIVLAIPACLRPLRIICKMKLSGPLSVKLSSPVILL